MPNWTPGPWTIVAPKNSFYGEPGDRAIAADVNGTKRIIAESFVKVALGDSVDAESNAKLIAAAPDLYDALEALLHCAEPQNRSGIEKAKAALAKARGEASEGVR